MVDWCRLKTKKARMVAAAFTAFRYGGVLLLGGAILIVGVVLLLNQRNIRDLLGGSLLVLFAGGFTYWFVSMAINDACRAQEKRRRETHPEVPRGLPILDLIRKEGSVLLYPRWAISGDDAEFRWFTEDGKDLTETIPGIIKLER